MANGALVYGNNRAGFGGRGIYVYRDSIEPEFPHLEEFLDPDGVFVDVGANTGIYTIKAAKHYAKNDGLVLAIEPFIDVLAVLFHNIQANKFTNVKLYNFCAAERTGSATLWRNFDKPNSFSLIQRDKKATSLPTLTVTLDDLFDWEGLDRLDYLKIDAEGSEQQVLLGAKKIVEKYRPIIQMEININDVPLNLSNYSVFHAPQSANKVCIPNEHSKSHLPKQFGWGQVA